jgi:hypothetical protein
MGSPRSNASSVPVPDAAPAIAADSRGINGFRHGELRTAASAMARLAAHEQWLDASLWCTRAPRSRMTLRTIPGATHR